MRGRGLLLVVALLVGAWWVSNHPIDTSHIKAPSAISQPQWQPQPPEEQSAPNAGIEQTSLDEASVDADVQARIAAGSKRLDIAPGELFFVTSPSVGYSMSFSLQVNDGRLDWYGSAGNDTGWTLEKFAEGKYQFRYNNLNVFMVVDKGDHYSVSGNHDIVITRVSDVQ